MKILFVAKHGCGGNQDEDAVTYALTELGHTVTGVAEEGGTADILRLWPDHDMLLFFKWSDWETMRQVKIPKVYWFFDLVDYPDPTISGRCQVRKDWMKHATEIADLGFCTDGDWVHNHPEKLVLLRQGADKRVMGPGIAINQWYRPDGILFTGLKDRCGEGRRLWVEEMQSIYGDQFIHVRPGRWTEGIYGRDLANLIASVAIVVAPDAPVTMNYWSNRVYMALGFGAFMIHPACVLAMDYEPQKEIVMYKDWDGMHNAIEYYLQKPDERKVIAEAGYRKTVLHHTYTHRCERLIQVVKERLGL